MLRADAITSARSASSHFLAVRDYRGKNSLPPPPDFGKKPLSVSRGENRSGRWTDRASTTLPTGYFPAPEIQRTVPAMDTRRFELPIAVATIPWSVINRRLCIRLVKFEFMARDIGRMRFAIPSYMARDDVYRRWAKISRYLY